VEDVCTCIYLKEGGGLGVRRRYHYHSHSTSLSANGNAKKTVDSLGTIPALKPPQQKKKQKRGKTSLFPVLVGFQAKWESQGTMS
jgi:hypothetical protein